MTVRQPRYSKEEFARRGDEIYESQVRQQVEEGNHGKIVAIDLETGGFEVDVSEIAACDAIASKPVTQMLISKFLIPKFAFVSAECGFLTKLQITPLHNTLKGLVFCNLN